MRSVCVRGGRQAAGAALFIGLTTLSLNAQSDAPRLTVWDGVYTDTQAARGATAFGQSCAGCHALTTTGKSPLAGEAFWKSFAQKTVGDLLDYVSANMPNGTPGSLNESTYRDIVAAMLKSNDFPAGPMELERKTSGDARIAPKDGNTELPANALARVVGCLTRNGTDWVLTNATAPVRAERASSREESAAGTLGTRTVPLRFVLTKLDSLSGSRVAVSGLLIGPGGEDGINVTAVNRVADRCP